MPDEIEVHCTICGAKRPSVEDAIEAGWYPSFWDAGDSIDSPICDGCVAEHCEFTGGLDGDEPTLKLGHSLPDPD